MFISSLLRGIHITDACVRHCRPALPLCHWQHANVEPAGDTRSLTSKQHSGYNPVDFCQTLTGCLIH
jgi:hypothetical protein